MVERAVFHNRTRRSRSIPGTLLRRGHLPALPLYYALRLSDLAREGFENSGSYRFADHIYRGVPSGRGVIGRWIDGRLLAMPAVRSFRSRFVAARDALAAFLLEAVPARPIHVLSVPSGIPRELVEAAQIAKRHGDSLAAVHFHALDLDARVLEEARGFAARHGIELQAHHGDALTPDAYPRSLSFVTCTGLGEFLADAAVVQLYRTIREVLEPGGLFVTSGMQQRRVANYLLRLAEITVHYRDSSQLVALAREAGFSAIDTRTDEYGIQTIMTCRR
jgi:SAM-dependent methyltransferase